jgi:branched-chain amino acid transport system substrate-binding protein
MKAAKAAEPDAFVAWSYPPDTFALTEQAMIEDLQVGAFYTAWRPPSRPTARASARRRRRAGPGGVNADDPAFQAYAARAPGSDRRASPTSGPRPPPIRLAGDPRAVDRGGGSRPRGGDAVHQAQHLRHRDRPDHFDENNNNPAFWTVGQWQDGVFKGVASRGRDGAVPVIMKDRLAVTPAPECGGPGAARGRP